jgi:hypothetical protein
MLLFSKEYNIFLTKKTTLNSGKFWTLFYNPGDNIAGGDVLATACHATNSPHLGGITVGWTHLPHTPLLPCRSCMQIVQS